LFADKKGLRLQAKKELSHKDFKYKCSARSPAIRELLIKKNEYERCREDTRREYSSLFAALEQLSVTEKDDYLQKCDGQVSVDCGERLFFRNGQISPTLLESYFCCPFCNFAAQGLRLREREETAVMATDSGNFIHALLEKTTKKLGELASEEEARTYATEVGKELLKQPLFSAQADTAAGRYSSSGLLSEGAEVAAAVFRQLKNSSYRVEETEKSVQTPSFRGKVDRVDETDKYVRVIDYKTGTIDDTALSYYTGRKLQLQLYMSAVKGDKTPAGVFYFPASVSYTTESEGKFRMKGFLNGDKDALLCGDNTLETSGGKSEFFEAKWNDNARLEKVMDANTFSDFLDYAVCEAEQGAAELKRGFIAPSPYKGECKYCRYGGMCGFNYDLTGERSEEGIKPKAIAEIARRHKTGEDKEDDLSENLAEDTDVKKDGKTSK
jgi:ATP-dependent helicase/nuclease subunit B